MFEESFANWLNVILAVLVMWFGFEAVKKQSGKMVSVLWYLISAAAILGLAELIDLMQLFPDGSLMSDLVYEKEIPVLVLLLLAVFVLKAKK